jgi:hypothetical protein
MTPAAKDYDPGILQEAEEESKEPVLVLNLPQPKVQQQP